VPILWTSALKSSQDESSNQCSGLRSRHNLRTARKAQQDYSWMAVTGISDPNAVLPNDGAGGGIAIIGSRLDNREDLM
jgi:hypothetical protein